MASFHVSEMHKNRRTGGRGARGGRIRRNRRRGFILEQSLIAVLIAVLMVPVCMGCIAPLRNVLSFNEAVQDEISAIQLRRVLLLSYDLEIHDTWISFVYQERPMELSKGSNHVILSPGTQIYFVNTDSCEFYEEDGLLWIMYERDDKSYAKVLAKLP